MITLLLATALAASPYADKNGDVVVKKVVQATPAEMFPIVRDFKTLRRVMPDTCTKEWVFGPNTKGPDAMTRVTMHLKAFKRRMTWVVSNEQPNRTITIEGMGDKGFATRLVFTPVEGGTEVVMASYVYAPPWPFKRYYFEKVVPEWEQCWSNTIDALDEAARK